jgi:hypothetical protein
MNNQTRRYIFIVSACLVGGILFYAINREWLFFFCAHTRNAEQLCKENCSVAARKKVSLLFWRHDRWARETAELVWPKDTAQALMYLTNSWLELLDEEQVLGQKITVQSVLLADNDAQALISFDHNPFSKESSTFAKWLLLEGLLKTIRENNVPIREVVFLVRHKPLRDYHLDFTNPWPIKGFFENQ